MVILSRNQQVQKLTIWNVKSMQEKQPAQLIIHVGSNDLLGNKNSDEMAKEIVQFANQYK